MTPYRIFVLLTCTLFAGNVSAWGALAGFPPVRIIDYSTGMPYWRGTASDASETPDVTNRQQSGEVRVSPVTTAVSCNVTAASADMVSHHPENQQNEAASVSNMTKILNLVYLGFLLLAATPGQASWGLYGMDGLNIVDQQLSSNLISERITQDMLDRSARGTARGRVGESRFTGDLSARTQQPSTTQLQAFQAPGHANVAAKLAASYPLEHRAQVERVFSDLLQRFGDIERQFGSPKNDLPTAVAGLIAASYMVYHDSEFPERQFKPLIEQLRAIIASSDQLVAASLSDRRAMYEEMAILAMFMAGAQREAGKGDTNASPSAIKTKMKIAAKSYLEQLLGVDAKDVQMTSDGLKLRRSYS